MVLFGKEEFILDTPFFILGISLVSMMNDNELECIVLFAMLKCFFNAQTVTLHSEQPQHSDAKWAADQCIANTF